MHYKLMINNNLNKNIMNINKLKQQFGAYYPRYSNDKALRCLLSLLQRNRTVAASGGYLIISSPALSWRTLRILALSVRNLYVH